MEEIIVQACNHLFEIQPNLFLEEFDINERTISGELSKLLAPEFGDYHVNCEYNRMTDEFGNQIPKRIHLNPNAENPSLVYPDIIVHKQENKNHNLLIIEIKMSWKNGRKEDDFVKLKRYMEELGYEKGLYLELGENIIEEMKWFEKEKNTKA